MFVEHLCHDCIYSLIFNNSYRNVKFMRICVDFLYLFVVLFFLFFSKNLFPVNKKI